MLYVDISVTDVLCGHPIGKKSIGSLKILNLGRVESEERGLVGDERVYKYKCKMNRSRMVSGEVTHNRHDEALILIQRVIDEVERKKVLKVLRSIKKNEKGVK